MTWQHVGTGLAVRPTVLSNGQIRVRLTPWLSYVTPGGGGTVEFSGRRHRAGGAQWPPSRMGGATSSLHSVTRQILGVRQSSLPRRPASL